MRSFLLLLVAAGCGSAAGPAPKPPLRVLIVTLDTLRPDHVGRNTPALDAFLAGARRYRGARAAVPLTVPTHASLLSGLEPASHGLHDNATALWAAGRSFRLLAEDFADKGYATAAFVAAPVLGRHTGLGAGFGTYRVADQRPYGPAKQQVDAAVAWIGKQKGAWFAWVHCFDPHFPYLAFDGDAKRPPTRSGAPDAERYGGEIRRVDQALERLLAAVDEKTIVVLASDHGEGLGEHNEPTHGPLCFATTIDILLAVRGPGLAAGSEDEAARSICDVAPTLRAWCGLPERETDGRPLSATGERIVVSESLQVWRVHGWGQCFAASDGRHTLVESGAAVELFDRKSDPGERKPLPLDGPAYERLDRALRAYRTRGDPTQLEYVPNVHTPYGTGRRPGSVYLSRRENAKQTDPRTRLDFWDELERKRQAAGIHAARRDDEALIKLAMELEALCKKEPTNPAPCHLLAEVRRHIAQVSRDPAYYREAAAATREAIERGYLSAAVLVQLLEDSFKGRDTADMRAALTQAAGARVVPDIALAEIAVQTALALSARKDPDALAQAGRIVAAVEQYHGGDGSELERLKQLLK